MKKGLLYLLLLAMPIITNAQIATGAKLGGNIVGKDINEKDINVQTWLDEGKTVIIDVFATWCGPCWSFHRAGVLEDLYEQYGPEGTDQIRVLGIEGDERTTSADLVGTGTNTLGDWTEGVKYPIMDDHTHNSLLKIAFFPTLYVIRPDGTVFEGGDFRYNADFWRLAAVDYDENSIASLAPVAVRTFCQKTNVEQPIKFYNFGTKDITSAKFDYIVNGQVVDQITSTKATPIFKEFTIITPKYSAEETTNFEIKVKEVNGEPVTDGNVMAFKVHNTELVKNSFKMVVTTDYYPGEFSWVLEDNFNTEIASATYRPGNDDQFGGGGADANKAFEYDLMIDDLSASCLSLKLTDSYGDGNTAIPAGAPLPGIEIYDRDGNLVKEKFESDYRFTSSNTIRTEANLLTSANDVQIADVFEVSPNPAHSVINLDINLLVDSKAHTTVINALGQTVMSMENVPSSINVETLSNGNYSIVVTTKEGTATRRFVKF